MAKIAVIGTGISGLTSAWILSQEHEVTLYEKSDYIGGHTNTRTVQFGDVSVAADTGFMVFNHRTYPNLVKMFSYLDVETIKTDMAFGISSNGGGFEFSSDDVFAQKRNLLSFSHWKMVISIIRFNRDVQKTVDKCDDTNTVKDLLTIMNLGKRFEELYLLPMSGAIWSTDKNNILNYPAKKFVSFFNNHGLLSPKTLNPKKRKEGRLQWYTVKNGSQTYVQKVLKKLNINIRLDCGVKKVIRTKNEVVVIDERGESNIFEHIVFASHPDQTLSMIDLLSDEEKNILGTFAYSKNMAYLHKDTSFMMKHTKKWPSWTYVESEKGEVEISYYMNRLQAIDAKYPTIVTLNPSREISEKDLFYKVLYEHPLFSVDTASAQEGIKKIQGKSNTWYAGAWLGHGFHEDGLKSALEIGRAFGLKPPWEK